MGGNARVKREAEERIKSMGLNKDILQAAKETANELADAENSLEVVKAAAKSQQALVERYEQAAVDAYASAEAALRREERKRWDKEGPPGCVACSPRSVAPLFGI